MTKIIGLCGYKQSGKSTASDVLVQCGWIRIPLAAPLKRMLEVLGVDREAIYGDDKEVPQDLLCGKSARHAMQTLGTEWGRNLIGSDVWLRAWAAEVEACGLVAGIVCDDLRFLNEAIFLQSMGADLIGIDRDGCISDGHASEKEVGSVKDNYCGNVIGNNVSIGEFKTQILDLVELMERK
jgi:hypothetical protein